MKCPYCGQHNDSEEDNCIYCGKSLRRAHKEQSIILGGMIAIVFILLVGSAGFLFASRGLDMSLINQNTINDTIQAQAETETTEEAQAEAAPETEEQTTETETEAPQVSVAQVTGTLVDADHVREVMDLEGYSRATIAEATATSSTPADDGSDIYTAKSAVDDSDDTSWQEGADGQGVGEQLLLNLDRDYGVRYIFLKLGSWTSENYYYQNNRPETLSITVGDSTFSVSFPDQMTEFCVELSEDVTTSQIVLQIENAYVGTAWDDTCITNVEVQGY